MNKITLLVQCKTCGRWRATETTDLNKAQFTCFNCGKTMKLRCATGWNVNYKVLSEHQQADYLVKILNSKEIEK